MLLSSSLSINIAFQQISSLKPTFSKKGGIVDGISNQSCCGLYPISHQPAPCILGMPWYMGHDSCNSRKKWQAHILSTTGNDPAHCCSSCPFSRHFTYACILHFISFQCCSPASRRMDMRCRIRLASHRRLQLCRVVQANQQNEICKNGYLAVCASMYFLIVCIPTIYFLWWNAAIKP